MADRVYLKRMVVGLFLVVTTIVASISLASTAFSAVSKHKNDLWSAGDFWAGIVSPHTAQVVAADQQLRRNYLDAIELTADLTKRLAGKFVRVPELQEASAHMERYRQSLATSTKRLTNRQTDPLSALGGLLSGALPGSGAGAAPGTGSANATAGGDLLSGLTGGIGDALSGIGQSLLQNVGGAALFLGTGLGAGAAQGLNIAPAPMTMQAAAKVASDNGMSATGLNPVIQNAAMGALASLLGSVNVSSVASLTANLDFKGFALSLSQGIGNGVSSGLNFSPQAMAMQPPVGNTTSDVVGTFGFGLSKSLTSNIDLSHASLSSINLQPLTGGQPVSMLALSLAQGIGNGASSGLKLTQANLSPPQGTSAADTAGAFGFGLTNTLTNNINTTALVDGIKNTNLNEALGNISLAQTASSFGSGLGSGAAAGLKLASAVIDAPNPNAQDVPSIAGNFAFGLTKSITENINTSQIASGSGSALSGLTSHLDIGRIAQGAAMGLVQGAGDAVNNMGGLQALINGTARISSTPLPAASMAFNDSVGGAATGFGQGLGGQGTLVGVQLLSQVNATSLVDGLISGNSGDSQTGAATPAAPATPSNATAVLRRNHFLPAEVLRRQVEVGAVSTNNSFNLSLVFNADTLSSVGQRAIDALGCEGISGLILVGLGLVQSGNISTGSVTNFNTTLIKQILPKGVMRFTSNGNNYQIDGTLIADNIDNNLLGAASGIAINGNPVIKFGAFLALHGRYLFCCHPAFAIYLTPRHITVLIALMGFILLVPFVLGIDAVRNLLVRLNISHILPKIPRWMDIVWLWVMSPTALVALLFGSLAGGNAGHFRTVHGVSYPRDPPRWKCSY